MAARVATEAGGGSYMNGRAMNELGDSPNQMRSDAETAQEAAGMAAFTLDVKAQRLTASALFGALYGRPRGAGWSNYALDEHVLDKWMHAEDRRRVAEDWARAVAGEPLKTEFRAVWPDGSIHWLRAHGKLAVDAGRLSGVLQDITEEKKREQWLLESSEELERFAYIASHDLQEPLRAVISFGDLLARKGTEISAENKRYLEFMRQGGARMQALVSDLLTFSRVLQAGDDVRETVDCSEVLEAVKESLQADISASGAVIEAGPLPIVQGNPQHWIQLFEQLISNGLKFRDERNPLIRIAAEKSGSGWHFCFSDNGIGFEMIYATRIFEAFKRLHSRAQYPGSGIGLALCRKIVERHGGRMWAESELGVGSKFWFSIP